MPQATWLRHASAQVLDLLIPRVCASCGQAIRPSTGELCEACAWELSGLVGGAYCRTCGDDGSPHLLIEGRCTACRLGKQDPRFDHFIRAGRYAGTLQRLILRFKKEVVLDRLLGDLLARAIEGRIDPRQIDLWVPIPSHWRRRISRGYQPTQLLARFAAKRWGGQAEAVLRMSRYVPPFHHGMSVTQRIEAIAGAFNVVNLAGGRDSRICLVDDVTTTGATLGEARRALRRSGVRWVAAAVLAKVSRLPVVAQGVDPSMRSP